MGKESGPLLLLLLLLLLLRVLVLCASKLLSTGRGQGDDGRQAEVCQQSFVLVRERGVLKSASRRSTAWKMVRCSVDQPYTGRNDGNGCKYWLK